MKPHLKRTTEIIDGESPQAVQELIETPERTDMGMNSFLLLRDKDHHATDHNSSELNSNAMLSFLQPPNAVTPQRLGQS